MTTITSATPTAAHHAGSTPASTDLLVAGLGPAGTALLSAAREAGELDRWLDRGLVVVDPDGDGSGQLGGYAVRSDTTGRVFAEVGRAALRTPTADEAMLLARCDDDEPLPLRVAAQLLAMAARPTLSAVAQALVVGAVTSVTPGPEGAKVTIATAAGPQSVAARNVVIACGGRAWMPAELSGLGGAVVHSDAVIRGNVAARGHVLVVGGSHSAFSAARVLLEGGEVDRVTIAHRSPIRVTYADAAAAAADGCRFGPRDVCPATGRVFRFGGLRNDSAALYRAIRDGAETRVELTTTPVSKLVVSADLVVAATGYAERVGSLLPRGGGTCTFDTDAALHQGGRLVAGVFGLGLGSGRRRDTATGGEPSFTSTIDGVWFYRNVAAPALLERISST